jgi:hypothetical protein
MSYVIFVVIIHTLNRAGQIDNSLKIFLSLIIKYLWLFFGCIVFLCSITSWLACRQTGLPATVSHAARTGADAGLPALRHADFLMDKNQVG